MNLLTEKAFRDMDQGVRIICDLKHQIYKLKVDGGISDKEKMYTLDGFKNQAMQIIKNVEISINQALHTICEENKIKGDDCFNATSPSISVDNFEEEIVEDMRGAGEL